MPSTRPINDAEKQNFETLVSAFRTDRICLVSSIDLADQSQAVLICAVNYLSDEEECFEFVPLARLCDGNPYERFLPPGHRADRLSENADSC